MLDTAIIGDLLLSDLDFPDTFVNRIHPDDLKEVDQPGTNEVIVNRYPHHHRFLVRLWFKTRNNKYISATFLCDTGAPLPMYMGTPTSSALRSAGVIVDDGNGYDTIQLNFQQHALQRRLVISETPQPHAPANIIGISLLTRMGMRIFLDAQDNDAASFDNLPIIQ